MRSTILALFGASLALAAPSDNMLLERGTLAFVGCFSSSSGLTSAPSYVYQSSSYCLGECGSAAVIGLTGGSGCLCGNSLPPSSSKVSSSNCNTPCTGFGQDMCGGTNFYSVYTTGNGQLESNPDSGSSSSSSSAAPSASATTSSAPSSTSASATVVTSVAPGQTVVITQSATASSNPSSGGGGSSTVGTAVGVVVGLIAVAAIAGGVFFYFRRRRQLAVEEEHRQRAQVSDFIQGGMERKAAAAPSFMSRGPDSRLDPEAGRRNSFGSVMDDSQDYSRKILRVANPDD